MGFGDDWWPQAVDGWWAYNVYAFGGLAGCLLCCLLMCAGCRRRRVPRADHAPRPRTFAESVLTWKQSQKDLDAYYTTMNSTMRMQFYLARAFFVVLFAWFVHWFVVTETYRTYLGVMTYVYLAVFCVEYVLVLLSLRQTLIPNFNSVQHRRSCVLIPFGGGVLEEKLPVVRKVLAAASAIFGGQAVYLLQNGRAWTPPQYAKVRAVCDEYGVRYAYIPLGNKSFAIYYAAKCLADPMYTQCLVIDDDVILPADFHVPDLGESVDALGYPIVAHASEDDGPWARTLVAMQSMEYEMSGLAKILQSRWSSRSSILATHGAIGLWRRDRLVEVMAEHDAVFHGEDLLMGIIAYVRNYNIKMRDDSFVPTQTPTKVFGTGGLYRQRVYSWDYIILKYIVVYLKLLLHRNPLEHLPLKLFILLELWTIFIDVQRIPLIVYAVYMHWFETAIFFGAMVVVAWCVYYWLSHVVMAPFRRPSSVVALLLMPVYKSGLLVCRMLGELRYLFVYQNVRQRTPLYIRNMPDLPSILEETGFTLRDVPWDRIWSDDAYLAQTLRRQKEFIRTANAQRAMRRSRRLRAEHGSQRRSRSSRRHSRCSLSESMEDGGGVNSGTAVLVSAPIPTTPSHGNDGDSGSAASNAASPSHWRTFVPPPSSSASAAAAVMAPKPRLLMPAPPPEEAPAKPPKSNQLRSVWTPPTAAVVTISSPSSSTPSSDGATTKPTTIHSSGGSSAAVKQPARSQRSASQRGSPRASPSQIRRRALLSHIAASTPSLPTPAAAGDDERRTAAGTAARYIVPQPFSYVQPIGSSSSSASSTASAASPPSFSASSPSATSLHSAAEGRLAGGGKKTRLARSAVTIPSSSSRPQSPSSTPPRTSSNAATVVIDIPPLLSSSRLAEPQRPMQPSSLLRDPDYTAAAAVSVPPSPITQQLIRGTYQDDEFDTMLQFLVEQDAHISAIISR